MKIISIALATAVAGLAPLLLPELQQQGGRGAEKITLPSGAGRASMEMNAARNYSPAARPEISSGGSNNNSVDDASRPGSAHPLPVLPDGAGTRNEDPVRKERGIIKEIISKRSQQAPADPSHESPLALPADIARIGMVELAAEDLARLGIIVGEEGIFATWQEEGKPKPFTLGFSIDGVVTPSRSGIENIPDFMPVAVTDDIGGYRALMYEETEEEKALLEELRNGGDVDPDQVEQGFAAMRERHENNMRKALQIGRLVPVLVRTGRAVTAEDSIAGRFRHDCIFWYEPGSKFLDRLPADVRERVEREMSLAGRLRDAERSAEENGPEVRSAIASDVLATVGESPYLDVLRSASGAIMETGIEPNPARERTALTYRLLAPRSVSLSLHDISGRRLRELVAARPADAGMQRQEVDLSGMPAGIYLVVISTDRGERAVQRVIVQQ